MQFQDLFELESSKVKEYLSEDTKVTRDKLGSFLKDAMRADTYAMRLTVSNATLEKVLFKPAPTKHEDLCYRFEEFAETFDEFAKRFEELDYNEDDFAEGEERTIEELEEHVLSLSKEIAAMRKLVAVAEKLREKEHKA